MDAFRTLEFHETVPHDKARALTIDLFYDCIKREGFGHSYIVYTIDEAYEQRQALLDSTFDFRFSEPIDRPAQNISEKEALDKLKKTVEARIAFNHQQARLTKQAPSVVEIKSATRISHAKTNGDSSHRPADIVDIGFARNRDPH